MDDTARQALEDLKVMAEETDRAILTPPCDGCDGCPGAEAISTRMCSDEELLIYLRLAGGDIRRAAYQVLMHKAQITGVTLAGGISLSDTSAYYLRLAQMYRSNRTGVVPRADDPERRPPC